jgi:hypothetical protein
MGAHDLRSATLTESGSASGARGRVRAMTYLATATTVMYEG